MGRNVLMSFLSHKEKIEGFIYCKEQRGVGWYIANDCLVATPSSVDECKD